MKTAVVILNWNTKDFLGKFLPGLIASVEGRDAAVAVADNGSTDGSAGLLYEKFPEVQVLPFNENYGFTGGYNRALEEIDAEYFVLLNSDIEVTPGWLDPLVEWMDSHPDCGACGPKLRSYYDRGSFEYAGAAGGLLDSFGYPYCRGRVFGRVAKDKGQYDSPADVLWISGACLMVRSSLWKELGGLDERFFAHMEEIDLCWRMQLNGWKITLVPSSTVYHIGGGTLPAGSPRKVFFNFRNNLLLLDNNLARTFAARGMSPSWSRLKAGLRLFFRMILDGLSALVYLLTLKPDNFSAVLKAHREFRRLRRGSGDLRTQRRAAVTGFGSLLLLKMLKSEI